MPAARLASNGILLRTSSDSATSTWRVIAPTVKTSPLIEIPNSCGIFDRSISAAGAASRCLMVGSNVMPPASGMLSETPLSNADISGTVFGW